MRILAIETSCDETAIAVLEGQASRGKEQEKLKILSNVVLSQIKIHKPFGGVVPNLAKREHQKNLPVVLKQALKEAKTTLKKIDAISVTYGPGLEPALWMGINFAKELAEKWKKPIIPVNHLEGHIYASYLPPQSPLLTKEMGKKSQSSSPLPLTKGKGGLKGVRGLKIEPPNFPLLALIVSGGHTELVLMKKHLDYKILGETLDDAAGEAFDKVARLLKLEYPGGPEISKLASKYLTPACQQADPAPLLRKERGRKKEEIPLPPYEGGRGLRGKGLFPRPMLNSPNLNFSFSGLKTAVLYYLRDNPNANKAEVAYEFEQAVVDVLIHKTEKAIKKYKPKSLVVGGGVAANKTLRYMLKVLIKKYNQGRKHLSHNPLPLPRGGGKGVGSEISLFLSPLWLTGDNAAMIATAAYFKIRLNNSIELFSVGKIKARGNLRLGQ